LEGGVVMLGTILVVVLILMLIGALPQWPHQGCGYGWAPSGGLGLVVLILVILLLLGRL
jgi:hypothetical protein